VGAFCGPRLRLTKTVRSESGSSENGTAVAKSSSVHSGFSASIISSLGLRFIPPYLPLVGFTEADYANTTLDFNTRPAPRLGPPGFCYHSHPSRDPRHGRTRLSLQP